jgi:hypothetical protein
VAKVRGQASFADLAPQLPEGFGMWGTDEEAWSGSGDLRTQLDAWLDRGSPADGPVRAIFGFCGAAALACALARRLAAPQPPAVVLFDPVEVGPRNMLAQLTDSLRQLAGGRDSEFDVGISEDDIDHRDVGELAETLTKHYTVRAAEVGAAKSIRPATMADLCRRFEAYLRYLALCTTAWSLERVPPSLVVLARGHVVPTEMVDVPVAHVDVTEHVLLGHPETARAATEVLVGATGGD